MLIIKFPIKKSYCPQQNPPNVRPLVRISVVNYVNKRSPPRRMLFQAKCVKANTQTQPQNMFSSWIAIGLITFRRGWDIFTSKSVQIRVIKTPNSYTLFHLKLCVCECVVGGGDASRRAICNKTQKKKHTQHNIKPPEKFRGIINFNYNWLGRIVVFRLVFTTAIHSNEII